MESCTRELHRALAGEAADGPARRCTRRALAGWGQMKYGREATPGQWEAVTGILGGVMPEWKAPPGGGKGKERSERVRRVVAAVGKAQSLTLEHLARHEAATGAWRRFEERRERARPLLQLILRAWQRRGRPSIGPQRQHLCGAAWEAWRSNETPGQQKQRRMAEGIRRLGAHCRLVAGPEVARVRSVQRWARALRYAQRVLVARRAWRVLLVAVRELLAEATKRRKERDGRARVAARKSTIVGTASSILAERRTQVAKEVRAEERAEAGVTGSKVWKRTTSVTARAAVGQALMTAMRRLEEGAERAGEQFASESATSDEEQTWDNETWDYTPQSQTADDGEQRGPATWEDELDADIEAELDEQQRPPDDYDTHWADWADD